MQPKITSLRFDSHVITDIVTTVDAVGSDAKLPTEQAVREMMLDKADTGFESRTTSTIPSTLATTTFTISVVSGSFPVWCGGVKFTKTGGASCATAIADAVGQHYIYFDTAGVLQNVASPWDILGNAAPVATVYWNGTAGQICEERHSCYRNKAWHKWAHDTIGARYHYGFAGTFSSSALSVAQGEIHDEDLEIETPVSALTTCRLLYRAAGGASMTWDTAVAITAKVTAGALKWDNGGTLADIGSNKYVTNWVYATTDVAYPICVVVGQAEYNNVSNARVTVTPTLAGMTTVEWKPIYRVIWQNNGGTPTYVESADYRTATTLSGAIVTTLPASAVTFTATGNIAATNVQAALTEIDADTPTGTVTRCGLRAAPSGWLKFTPGEAVSRSTYAVLFAAIVPSLGVFTVTQASPAVLSNTAHGLAINDSFFVTTTGALYTGMAANTLYFVITAGFGADAFEFSATLGGAAINTSGSQSGVHTLWACPFGLGNGSTTFNLP